MVNELLGIRRYAPFNPCLDCQLDLLHQVSEIEVRVGTEANSQQPHLRLCYYSGDFIRLSMLFLLSNTD
jgi:hypothetical protein